MKGMIAFDPRVKLLLFLVTCCFVMSVTEVIPIALLGLFLMILLCVSGKYGFAIKSFAVMALVTAGSVCVQGKIPGIPGILLLAVCVLVRMMIPIIMAFTLVFQTTTISQFMSAFQKMKLPVKIIIPVVIMFRFMPTVREEWIGIRKAMAFRGISLSPFSMLRHPIITIERILIPLLFSVVSIIEELAAASLARGLDSDRERTCLVQVRMHGWDYGCLIITLGYAGIWLLGYVGWR